MPKQLFQPGVSGNPGGRPKGPSPKTVLLRQLGQKGPDGRRNVDAIIAALIEQARDGKIDAIREILDRVDGKVPQQQQVTGDGGGPLRIASYDIHVGLAAIAPRSEPDRLAPVEASVLGDGSAVGQDDDGR